MATKAGQIIHDIKGYVRCIDIKTKPPVPDPKQIS